MNNNRRNRPESDDEDGPLDRPKRQRSAESAIGNLQTPTTMIQRLLQADPPVEGLLGGILHADDVYGTVWVDPTLIELLEARHALELATTLQEIFFIFNEHFAWKSAEYFDKVADPVLDVIRGAWLQLQFQGTQPSMLLPPPGSVGHGVLNLVQPPGATFAVYRRIASLVFFQKQRVLEKREAQVRREAEEKRQAEIVMRQVEEEQRRRQPFIEQLETEFKEYVQTHPDPPKAPTSAQRFTAAPPLDRNLREINEVRQTNFRRMRFYIAKLKALLAEKKHDGEWEVWVYPTVSQRDTFESFISDLARTLQRTPIYFTDVTVEAETQLRWENDNDANLLQFIQLKITDAIADARAPRRPTILGNAVAEVRGVPRSSGATRSTQPTLQEINHFVANNRVGAGGGGGGLVMPMEVDQAGGPGAGPVVQRNRVWTLEELANERAGGGPAPGPGPQVQRAPGTPVQGLDLDLLNPAVMAASSVSGRGPTNSRALDFFRQRGYEPVTEQTTQEFIQRYELYNQNPSPSNNGDYPHAEAGYNLNEAQQRYQSYVRGTRTAVSYNANSLLYSTIQFIDAYDRLAAAESVTDLVNLARSCFRFMAIGWEYHPWARALKPYLTRIPQNPVVVVDEVAANLLFWATPRAQFGPNLACWTDALTVFCDLDRVDSVVMGALEVLRQNILPRLTRQEHFIASNLVRFALRTQRLALVNYMFQHQPFPRTNNILFQEAYKTENIAMVQALLTHGFTGAPGATVLEKDAITLLIRHIAMTQVTAEEYSRVWRPILQLLRANAQYTPAEVYRPRHTYGADPDEDGYDIVSEVVRTGLIELIQDLTGDGYHFLEEAIFAGTPATVHQLLVWGARIPTTQAPAPPNGYPLSTILYRMADGLGTSPKDLYDIMEDLRLHYSRDHRTAPAILLYTTPDQAELDAGEEEEEEEEETEEEEDHEAFQLN